MKRLLILSALMLAIFACDAPKEEKASATPDKTVTEAAPVAEEKVIAKEKVVADKEATDDLKSDSVKDGKGECACKGKAKPDCEGCPHAKKNAEGEVECACKGKAKPDCEGCPHAKKNAEGEHECGCKGKQLEKDALPNAS